MPEASLVATKRPRRPHRPLIVSVTVALFGLFAVAALVGSIVLLFLFRPNPFYPERTLYAGLGTAAGLLFGVYALALAAANHGGRPWAWSASVYTCLGLLLVAGGNFLVTGFFVFQGLLTTSGVPLETLPSLLSLVLFILFAAPLVRYHRPDVRAYFGRA